jgi:hypothetical protein
MKDVETEPPASTSQTKQAPKTAECGGQAMIDTHAETGANATRTDATLRQLMDEQAAAMRSRDADYLV